VIVIATNRRAAIGVGHLRVPVLAVVLEEQFCVALAWIPVVAAPFVNALRIGWRGRSCAPGGPAPFETGRETVEVGVAVEQMVFVRMSGLMLNTVG